MEAIRVKRGAEKPFNYMFERRTKEGGGDHFSMISISHCLKPALRYSLGGDARQEGVYRLTEIEIPNGVVAWQSYVIRDNKPVSCADGKISSPPILPHKQGSNTFDQSVLQAGDTVIWRMVAIRRLPDPERVASPK